MTRLRRPGSSGSSSWWSRFSGALLATALVGSAPWWASCQTPTSATVVVTTNVRCEVPTPAPSVSFVAASPDELVGGEDLGASSTKECLGQGEIGRVVLLPAAEQDGALAFRVVMGVGRATDTCGAVTPEFADPWDRCIVARRRLGFVDGEAIEIAVPLLEDCLGVECSETAASFTTCVGNGECVSGDIDPNDCLESSCDEDDLRGSPTTVASSSSSDSSSSDSSSSGQGEGGAGGTSSSSSGDGGEGGGGSSSSGGGEGGAAGSGGSGGGGGTLCEPPCMPGQVCVAGECEAIDCNDGARNGDETDTDCGGTFCPPCGNDRDCGDPLTGAAENESCQSRTCDGESFNPPQCVPCADAGACGPGTCQGGVCVGPGGGSSPQGATCSGGASCQSGSCSIEYGPQMGVCCNEACTGACRSCEEADTGFPDGFCADKLAGENDYECTPAAGMWCSTHACDGEGACELLPEETECREGDYCTGPALTTNRCNAAGACVNMQVSCPDGCSGDVCL